MAFSAQHQSPRITNSIWIPVAILGSLLLISLVIQLSMAWLSYSRIVPVDQHVDHLEQLQRVLSSVERTLAYELPDESQLAPETRKTLRQTLQQLINKHENLADTTPVSLEKARQILLDDENHPREILINVLEVLRNTFQQEASAHKTLTRSIHDAAFFEVQVGTFTLIILPISLILLLFMMRKRILKPLQQMESMMSLLGNRQYQRIPSERFDPMLQPLANNYNNMVVRLSELEEEHLNTENNLQQQVESATRTLIEQQRILGNTERLAALGEVMARLAHELRNPLAGVKMACSNLKSDMTDNGHFGDYQERITMVSGEIDRMINLLNSLLDQARHDPEQINEISINKTIDDLLMLARYQIPTSISLHHESREDIRCRLPDTQLRQALLNLIINAQQAMGDKQGIITLKSWRDADTLRIQVCDQGPGFPEEILHQGIRAFSTYREGGTGLGLSMVQRFVRNQNGSLELSNQAGGACVTLKLGCIFTANASHKSKPDH